MWGMTVSSRADGGCFIYLLSKLLGSTVTHNFMSECGFTVERVKHVFISASGKKRHVQCISLYDSFGKCSLFTSTVIEKKANVRLVFLLNCAHYITRKCWPRLARCFVENYLRIAATVIQQHRHKGQNHEATVCKHYPKARQENATWI